jgi:hypothetical protein
MDSIIDNFSFFLFFFAFGRTHSLVHAGRYKILTWTTKKSISIILFAFSHNFRVIFHIILFLISMFGLGFVLACFWFKIVIVGYKISKWWFTNNNWAIFLFRSSIIEFHSKVIIFFVLIELVFIEYKYFGESS